MNFKKLFADFPVIDTQFDIVSVDAFMYKDEEEEITFYSPVLTYTMFDKKTQKSNAGFMLQTGAVCTTYLELAEFVHKMATAGLFLVDLSAYGTIFSEAGDVVEAVNWNDYIDHIQQQEDGVDQTEPKTKPTLH